MRSIALRSPRSLRLPSSLEGRATAAPAPVELGGRRQLANLLDGDSMTRSDPSRSEAGPSWRSWTHERTWRTTSRQWNPPSEVTHTFGRTRAVAWRAGDAMTTLSLAAVARSTVSSSSGTAASGHPIWRSKS